MNRDAPGQHARGTHAAAQNERTVRQMRAHAKQHGERADTHRTPRGAESAMHSQLEHTGGSGRKGLSCGGCARPRVRARARTHRPRKHVRRRTGKQQGTAAQHQQVGTKRTIWSARQCATAPRPSRSDQENTKQAGTKKHQQRRRHARRQTRQQLTQLNVGYAANQTNSAVRQARHVHTTVAPSQTPHKQTKRAQRTAPAGNRAARSLE